MKLWDAKQIAEFIGVKPRTVKEHYITKAGFPKPFRLNARVLRWDADEVVAFVKKCR